MNLQSASTLVESIFLDALDVPEPDRDAFLAAACAGDEALRQRVVSLLARADHDAPGGCATTFFQRSAGLPLLATPSEHLPVRLGRYDLARRIGEGSFGVVYLAAQRAPVRREVAIKIVRAGLESPEVLRRFDSERQTLATLDHPNIARLYDAGSTPDGRPFFVMELLDGQPLTQFCDSHVLSLRDRLRLFLDVCAGVEHAHRRAILHRDLKPTNLLMQRRDDGRPCVKVIDFGIARALGGGPGSHAMATEAGRMMGTPEYMSPEQAAGDAALVDTRSDVYALGVLLYELLCGRLPFASGDLRRSTAEMRRLICEVPPPPPSDCWGADHEGLKAAAAARATSPQELRATLKRELEWIPLKALRKEPGERYAGVADLAEDVQSYLDGLPLRAARQTRWYRARKFVARHRTPVAFGAIAALSLIAALIVSVALLHRANRAETNALSNERNANITSAMLRVQQGNALVALGRFGRASEQFEKAQAELSRLSGPSWIADLGLWDLARNARPPMLEWKLLNGPVVGPQFLPDSRRVVVASGDGEVLLFDVRTGAVHARHRIATERWEAVRYNAKVNKVFLSAEGGRLFEWSLDKEPPTLLRSDLGRLLAVDPTGAWTLHADRDGVALWHVGEPSVRKYPNPGHTQCGEFLPDGNFITAGTFGANICVWSMTAAEPAVRKIPINDWCNAMAVSADGLTAAVGVGHVVHIYDLTSGAETGLRRGHDELITSLIRGKSPRSASRFFTSSWDGGCRGWNFANFGMDVFQGPSQPLSGIDLSPDDACVVAGGWDGKVYVWSTAPSPALVDIHHRERTTWVLLGALLCDDEILAIGEATSPTVLYDCRTGERLMDLGDKSLASTLMQGVTSTQLGYESEGALAIYDLATSSRTATLGEKTKPGEERRQVYSWRAQKVPRAAVWRRHVDLTVWDLASGKMIRKLSDSSDLTEGVNISPDGRYVMAVHEDPANGVELFEVDEPGRSWRLPGKRSTVSDDPISIAFSGDGETVLTRRRRFESFARLRRTIDQSIVQDIPDRNGVISADQFWPDDDHLLSTLEFGDALLRGRADGETLYTFREVGPIATVSGLRRLVTKQEWKSHVTICDLDWPVRRRELTPRVRAALERVGADRAAGDDLATLGRWFALHGADDWAVDCFTRAGEAGVDPLDVAVSYARLGDHVRAAAEYERALKMPGATVARRAHLQHCLAYQRGFISAASGVKTP